MKSLTILIILAAFAITKVDAHVGYHANYLLRFDAQKQLWQLTTTVNTALLKNVIIANDPYLDGTNLNSPSFQTSALDYLSKHIWLNDNKSTFHPKGKSISFGGHDAVAMLEFTQLPANIDAYGVHINCFAETDHEVSNELDIRKETSTQSYSSFGALDVTQPFDAKQDVIMLGAFEPLYKSFNWGFVAFLAGLFVLFVIGARLSRKAS